MRQRNNTSTTLTIPAIPADVHPGDVVEWPTPITGLTPVDEHDETPADRDEPPARPHARHGRRTKTSAAEEDATP